MERVFSLHHCGAVRVARGAQPSPNLLTKFLAQRAFLKRCPLYCLLGEVLQIINESSVDDGRLKVADEYRICPTFGWRG